MATAGQLDLGLRIVGDSKQAVKAIEELEKEFDSLSDASEEVEKDLEKVEVQEASLANETRSLSSSFKEVGETFKRVGGEIKAFGGELTLLTSPFTILAGLSLANVFEVGKIGEGTEAVNQFASSVTLLTDQFKILTTEIGTVLAPMFTPIINSITNLILYFRGLSDETKQLIGAVALTVSALGPFLVVIGSLVTALGIAMPAITALGGAIASIAGVLASPIALLTSLGVTVAGIVNVFLKLRDAGVDTFTAIQKSYMLFATGFNKYVVGSVLTGVQKVIQGLSYLTSFVSDEMAASISSAADYVGEAVAGLDSQFEFVKSDIDETLSTIGTSAGEAFTFGLSKSIPEAINNVRNAFNSVSATPVIEDTRTALQRLQATSEEVYNGLRDGLLNGISGGLNSIADGTKSVADAFADMTKSILKDIQSIIIRQAVLQGLEGAGFNFSSGGPVLERASGGYISGPGTGTSDSIPARLSNGEYVIKASSVKQLGVGFLNRLNALGGAALKTKSQNSFANGGIVTGSQGQVSVEIINSGEDKRVSNATFDPESMVVSVFLEDLNKNGSISKGISNTFGIKRGNMR